MNRKFKGVWIPRSIWLSKDLSITEKCLLVEIDSLSGAKGCFASNNYFSEFLGVSTPTITRAIKRLTKLGLIESDTVKKRSDNGKVSTSRLIKMITPPNQNDEATANQNDEYINTVNTINTINNMGKQQNKASRFVKPELEEIESYCKERGNSISPSHFFDYYESKGWMIGKNKMKCWKSAIRTWERNSFSTSKPKRSVNDLSGMDYSNEEF